MLRVSHNFDYKSSFVTVFSQTLSKALQVKKYFYLKIQKLVELFRI